MTMLASKILRRYTSARIFGAPFLRKLSQLYIDVYDGQTYDPMENGEYKLLERLSGELDVVFDVGANVGGYVKLVRQVAPGAQVHAFEIIPATYRELEKNFPEEKYLQMFGLSDQAGISEAQFDAGKTGSTRMVIDERYDKNGQELITIQTRRGDDYCQQHGISSIDLLKIDVEGAEHLVIDGFGEFLHESVSVIQFEYNHARIHSGTLLIDFYDKLGKTFALGRLTQRGVIFKNYALEDEDFRGPNYVAVRRDRPDLIQRLTAERP